MHTNYSKFSMYQIVWPTLQGVISFNGSFLTDKQSDYSHVTPYLSISSQEIKQNTHQQATVNLSKALLIN